MKKIFLAVSLAAFFSQNVLAQQPPAPPIPPPPAPVATTGIVINPTPATTNQGINIQQTGPTTGGQATQLLFNNVSINSDQSNVSGGAGNNADAFLIFYQYGGPNAQGAKFGLYVSTNLSAATRPGDNNPSYAAANFLATASSNNNGTNTGAGAVGALSGIDAFVNATAAATNWKSVTGAEIDTQCLLGCTTKGLFGTLTVRFGTGAAGATNDAAAAITTFTGATPWTNALLLTDWSGAAPLLTTGCAICTDGNAHTILSAIDFSPYTVTNLLKGPNGVLINGGSSGSVNNPSPVMQLGSYFQTGNNCVSHLALNGTTYGFSVTNAGNVAECSAGGFSFYPNGGGIAATPALFIATTGAISFAGQVGVSCAANTVTLLTEVVTNGLVTHC